MATSRKNNGRKQRNKVLKLLFVSIALLAVVLGAYFYFHNRNQTIVAPDAGPKTTKKSDAEHKNIATSSFSQGGAVDQNGSTVSNNEPSDPSQWTASSSGVITLQQPSANAILKSGDTVSGTSQTTTVQFRLVDDTAGVLAQGSLSVVNGKFSGILQFKAYGTSGALKIYSIDSSSGAEINHADIKIKLAP